MLTTTVLNWINSNAPAITALATIFLVLITSVYVVTTYLLVREQRRQKQIPNVEYEFDPELSKVARTGGRPRADLKIQNVGDGTAVEVVFLEGPGEGIPVAIPALGERMTLLPGEHRIIEIRPTNSESSFPGGDLPLILSFSEGSYEMIVFKVLLLEFREVEGRWGIRNVGSISGIYSVRDLKRLGCRNRKPKDKVAYLWSRRSAYVSTLLLDDSVRASLKADLEKLLVRLRGIEGQMRAVRTRL